MAYGRNQIDFKLQIVPISLWERGKEKALKQGKTFFGQSPSP
jgi:hypothetical protein